MVLLKYPLILATVLGVASALVGQERTQVTLSGTVQDPSGAAVVGASIDAKLICKCSDCPDGDCKCCPGAITATTDESGTFKVSIVPGPYTITVSGQGIETTTVETNVTAGPTDSASGGNKVSITVNRSSGANVQ